MSNPATPATPAGKLMFEAQEAETLRSHQTHPAVVALTVDRARRGIERTMWFGIGLGLVFTMVTVQEFAAGEAADWTLPWMAAWLLAPLVEIPLLAILRGEQMLGRYGITDPGPWVRRARWGLLTATYAMNTWIPWSRVSAPDGGWRDVLLHSVPPLAVLVAAEALTDMREALGRAVSKAAAARPPKLEQRERPSPRPRTKPDLDKREQAPPPPPPPPTGTGPLGDGRTMRQIGVDWAVENWADNLRPVDIGAALMALGVQPPPSKGERSKMRADAAAIIAKRRGEPAPEPVDESEQDADGDPDDTESEPAPVTAGASA